MYRRTNSSRLAARLVAAGFVLFAPLANAADVCDSTSAALLAAGDVAGALARCEERLAVAQATLPPEHPDVARYRHGIGVLSYTLGDDDRARTELEAALLLYERASGPDAPPIADVLGTLGSIALEVGDVPGAVSAQRRSVTILEKQDSLGTGTAGALDRLGTALAASGEYKAARASHRRALELLEAAGGDSVRLVPCLQHLADDARLLGDPDRSRTYLLRSRAILLAGGGSESYALASSISRLAALAADDGDLDRARAHDREVVSILRRALGPEHPVLAQALASYAGSLIRTGHNQDAVDAALEAESIRRDHLRFVARSLPEGEALRYAGQLASGLGVAVAASIRTWDSTMVEQVWDATVRSRALVLDEIAARHRWADLRADSATIALGSEGSRTRQCLARLSLRGPEGLSPAVYRSMLERLKSASEETDRALRARNASARLDRARAAAGLADVRATLRTGTGLVSLWRYLDPTLRPRDGNAGPSSGPARAAAWSYAAFVTAGASREARVVPLGDAEELDSLVSAWRRSVVAGSSKADSNGAARDERTLGRILRQRLWDPIAPHVAGLTRVVLVPDGSFSLVNPAALRLDDGRFLVDSGPTFQIVSSERDLIGPARPSASGAGLLAVADPDFDAPHHAMSSLDGVPEGDEAPPGDDVYRGSPCDSGATARHWSPLPGSAREVETIAEIWKTRSGETFDVLRGEAATEGSFRKLAPGKKALHLATHGFFSGSCSPGENPLARSGLALAGANSGPADSADGAPTTEDGILTADEISGMDLGSVECAVLSACETGVGVVRAGEGVLGLRRAFEVAGARNLVMTLWPVTDRAAREWSVKFYEARLAKGLDAASAAREASRSVLEERRASGATDDPSIWAAFLASGR